MKKMFFFAAAATIAFVSCTKDIEVPANNNVANNEPAISFQVGSSFDVAVRAAVGGTGIGTDLNNWAGQTLHVYMFKQNSMTPAYNKTSRTNYFENTPVYAPTTGATGTASYGAPQYYPTSGNFDFFAYHAGGAATASPQPVLNEHRDTTAYTLAVTIDGTHDLMVAKAWLNGADSATYKTKLNEQLADADKIVNFTDAKFGTACGRVYSAYSARRGIQPRFTFEHLLSRFVFKAEAAEEDATGDNGIKIEKIEVAGVQVNGVMTIASLAGDLKVDFAGQSKTLELKDAEGNPMEEASLTWNPAENKGESEQLGESMLLPAGVTEYVAKIYYKQNKKKVLENGNVTYTLIEDVYEAPIKLASRAQFKPGFQYTVNIKVYDFQEIVLTADLTAWEESDEQPEELDPEK